MGSRKGGETHLGTPISEDAMQVWQIYLDIFQRRWNIKPGTSEYIGQTACDVFEAEFVEHGEAAYSTSIALPIRNSTYQAFLAEWRWKWLREMGIMSPVLD